MANGASVTGINPDYYVNLEGNQNLQVGNFILYVNGDIERNIYLPKINTTKAKFGLAQNHLYVYCHYTGAGANVNIYPNADDSINNFGAGVPLVIAPTANSFSVTDLLPITNGQVLSTWVTSDSIVFGGGGSAPSLGWNLAVACDVITFQTTITITALKTIPHPFSLTAFAIGWNGTGFTGAGFGVLSINAGDTIIIPVVDPVLTPSSGILFDSLGNWSNAVTGYECHA